MRETKIDIKTLDNRADWHVHKFGCQALTKAYALGKKSNAKKFKQLVEEHEKELKEFTDSINPFNL